MIVDEVGEVGRWMKENEESEGRGRNWLKYLQSSGDEEGTVRSSAGTDTSEKEREEGAAHETLFTFASPTCTCTSPLPLSSLLSGHSLNYFLTSICPSFLITITSPPHGRNHLAAVVSMIVRQGDGSLVWSCARSHYFNKPACLQPTPIQTSTLSEVQAAY